MIQRDVFKPGDQLPTEKELGEKLNVGRSTVREALQILSTLNLVQTTTGHGTFVKEPTTANILRADMIGFLIGNEIALDLLEAREMIEPALIRLACLRGTDQDFDAMERLLDKHEEALRNRRLVNEYGARFHLLIAAAAQNEAASIFMSSIMQPLMSRGRTFDNMPDYLERELAEHRELLRLMRLRDPEQASEFLIQHIVDAATTYARAEATEKLRVSNLLSADSKRLRKSRNI